MLLEPPWRQRNSSGASPTINSVQTECGVADRGSLIDSLPVGVHYSRFAVHDIMFAARAVSSDG